MAFFIVARAEFNNSYVSHFKTRLKLPVKSLPCFYPLTISVVCNASHLLNFVHSRFDFYHLVSHLKLQ